MNKYRSIDNSWDLDEFHCGMNAKCYVNGELKAKLLPGGVFYFNGGLLVEKLLFPYYGGGSYKIIEDFHLNLTIVRTTTLVKTDSLGKILINSWRCGDNTLYFYFEHKNKVQMMSYDFEVFGGKLQEKGW